MDSVCKSADEKFGVDAQVFMAIEEMAELMKELSKAYPGKNNGDEIRSEIADVEIMMMQMRYIFDIKDAGSIDDIKQEKLARLQRLIESKSS